MGKITALRLTQAQQLFLFFCFPGALHLCTTLRMKVSSRPPWTSVSLCNPLTRLSPTASSLQGFLCLSAALTPVASRLPSLSSSHQRPQTGWQQITFSSTKKTKYIWQAQSQRKRVLHPLPGTLGLAGRQQCRGHIQAKLQPRDWVHQPCILTQHD